MFVASVIPRQCHGALLESLGYEGFVHMMTESRRGPEDDHECDPGHVSWDEEVHGHLGALDAKVRGVSEARRCRHFGTKCVSSAGGEFLKHGYGYLEYSGSYSVSPRVIPPPWNTGIYSRKPDKGHEKARHDPAVVDIFAP